MKSRQKTKLWGIGIILILSIMLLAACASDNNSVNNNNDNGEGPAQVNNDDNNNGDDATRTIQHYMNAEGTEVPANPQRVVVLTGDALEAVLSVGITPVGSVEAMGDRQWYDHLEEYMDGVVNVGGMSSPDLEAILQLEPDLILGTGSRQEESYELLNEIAPTIFTESHTLGQWRDDFLLYVDAVNKLEEGQQVLADFDEQAEQLSKRLADAGKLDEEVGILRFTAGQGRFFYNMSYSGSIIKQLGFARPENHDVDDQWIENITQERIPEMDADILFYFVLDQGDGEAIKFADEWMDTQLFQNLRASQKEQLYEVSDAYWNMTYGILSADYVLEDIERYILGE